MNHAKWQAAEKAMLTCAAEMAGFMSAVKDNPTLPPYLIDLAKEYYAKYEKHATARRESIDEQ